MVKGLRVMWKHVFSFGATACCDDAFTKKRAFLHRVMCPRAQAMGVPCGIGAGSCGLHGLSRSTPSLLDRRALLAIA